MLIELRSKIGAAIRAATPPPAEDDNQLDGEVSITATEDGQRAELFLELQALQEQGELEDGLLELKAAASEPIAPA